MNDEQIALARHAVACAAAAQRADLLAALEVAP